MPERRSQLPMVQEEDDAQVNSNSFIRPAGTASGGPSQHVSLERRSQPVEEHKTE